MLKRFAIIISSIILLLACNTQNSILQERTNVNNSGVAAVKLPVINGKHCYAYIKNKDSILLTINIIDSLVSGNLVYKLYEKDKNDGTLSGKMNGDTLFADYTFSSEGLQSVREICFLINDNIAKEGHGKTVEKNDKIMFIKPLNIQFDTAFVLNKTDCGTSN